MKAQFDFRKANFDVILVYLAGELKAEYSGRYDSDEVRKFIQKYFTTRSYTTRNLCAKKVNALTHGIVLP